MPKPKGGLGRGLDALIPQPLPQDQPPEQPPDPYSALTAHYQWVPEHSALTIPIDSISPNPRQPRQGINQAELDELAASIQEHGILQPLLVARNEEGGYNLIVGERRWRAAIQAGLGAVPVVVKEATTRQMLELALVENLQRSDLNAIEEASAYKSLMEEFGLTQEQVASRVGKSRQAVANSLRLLRLPQQVQESLILGLITEGHARAILQVPDEETQLRLMERTVADGLSVRQVEALARRLAARPEQEAEQPERDSEETPLYDPVRDLEERFRDALGTKVQLSRSRRGGKLVIYFFSDEELDRIYSAIVGD